VSLDEEAAVVVKNSSFESCENETKFAFCGSAGWGIDEIVLSRLLLSWLHDLQASGSIGLHDQ